MNDFSTYRFEIFKRICKKIDEGDDRYYIAWVNLIKKLHKDYGFDDEVAENEVDVSH